MGHTWRRTITKAATYRVATFLVGLFALNLVFGIPPNLGFWFNLALGGMNFAIFVANEALWRRTSWGKPKNDS